MKVNNSLIPNNNADKKLSFSNFLTNQFVKQKIIDVVGGKDSQKFMTAILSAVTNNPALQECDSMSILNCAFLGEGLKLSPSPQLGQYYMVPFENKKRGIKEAQFQLGYKGYIQLAERSGNYKKLNVLAIKEGELIKYDPLNEEIEVNLIEDDEIRENTPTIGYYAMFEYMNGFRKTMYWTKKKMLVHADRYSQAFNLDAKKGKDPKYDKVSYEDYVAGKVPESEMWKYSSFWYKDFDGMAFKTMLRQLISKWGIMSIEMQRAYDNDMATIQDDGQPYYIENDKEQSDDTNTDIIIEPDSQEEETTKKEAKPKKTKSIKNETEEPKSTQNEQQIITTDEDIENEFFN